MAVSGINGNMSTITTDSTVNSLKEASDKSFEERLNAAMEKSDKAELKNACKQFEGIMLSIMFKQMKATINKSDLITQDPGMEIFQGMLDDKLMENASEISSFGLADVMYKQLSKRTASDIEEK